VAALGEREAQVLGGGALPDPALLVRNGDDAGHHGRECTEQVTTRARHHVRDRLDSEETCMTRTRTAGSLLAIGLVLTACGSGGGGNGEADKSANQILADATSALKSATSFRIAGTATDSSGPGSFDVTFVVGAGGGAKGKLTNGGATAQFVYSGGKFYVQGKDFFTKFGGPQAGAVVGDRWVLLPASAAGQDFAAFTDPSALATCLSADHGTISKGGTATVDGHEAVILVDKGDKPGTAPGRLYVATSGTAYPVKVDVTGATSPGTPPGGPKCSSTTGSSGGTGGTASLTLSQFNATVTITPPPNPLDLSTLGG
jgi:hypothetical protein